MTPMEALLKYFGSQAKMATAAGVSQVAVWRWFHKEIPEVPADHVLDLSKATNWALTPHFIRPDIYPNPTDALPFSVRADMELQSLTHDQLASASTQALIAEKLKTLRMIQSLQDHLSGLQVQAQSAENDLERLF